MFDFLEEHEVLPGEFVVGGGEFEVVGGVFLEDLFFGHFVIGADGDGFVFGAVFDEGDSAVFPEGLMEAFEHVYGV